MRKTTDAEKAYQRGYYQKNKDKLKEYKRAYYLANREKYLERNRVYAEAHKGENAEKSGGNGTMKHNADEMLMRILEDVEMFRRSIERGAPNPNYQEIIKLWKMLLDEGIPCEVRRWLDGVKLKYCGHGETQILSAVQNKYSYGAEEDRIEILGLLTDKEARIDSVCGWLTAEQVFERIKKHWEGGNNG